MEFWQAFQHAETPDSDQPRIWKDSYPAAMPDGSRLPLPLHDQGELAVAELRLDQAAFAVLDRFAAWMAEIARPCAPDIVLGLPSTGHLAGAAVARALGHENWVAPGTSRKLWYEDALSVPMAGIETALTGRRLWLDPRLADRLAGRRVLLVDDVISTGTAVVSGLELLNLVGVRPVAICVALLQGDRWRRAIPDDLPLLGVAATPLFKGVVGGWAPLPDTEIVERCPLLAAQRAGSPGPQ